MKKITILGFALGLLLGAVTTASATGNGNSCEKKPWLPHCIQQVGGDSISSAQAEAISIAIQTQLQQQAQQQGQTLSNDIDFGDSYVSPAINGGDGHYCISSPWGGFCIPMKINRIAKRAETADKCFLMPEGSQRQAVCLAVTDDSPPLQAAYSQTGVYDVSRGEDKRAKAAAKKGEWVTIRLGTFRCVDYRAEFKAVVSGKLAKYADRICAG